MDKPVDNCRKQAEWYTTLKPWQNNDELNLSHEERAKRREIESKPIAEAFFSWAESGIVKKTAQL